MENSVTISSDNSQTLINCLERIKILEAALIKARGAIQKQQTQMRILIPEHGMVNDERMALMSGDEALTAINEVLS